MTLGLKVPTWTKSKFPMDLARAEKKKDIHTHKGSSTCTSWVPWSLQSGTEYHMTGSKCIKGYSVSKCHDSVNGTKYVCVQELVSTRFSQKGFSDGLLYSKNKGKCHYTSSVPFKEEGCQWCKVRLCTGSTHGSTEASIHQQTISFQKTPALTSGWFTAERAAGTVWVL